MTNHVHLLITPSSATGIGKVMQSVSDRYVQRFNTRYRRSGTLWEGRYRSVVVDSECYLLTCYRYIELNPVRAGIVRHPAEYRWSSYRANALGWGDSMVTPHELYLSLDSDASVRRATYRALCETSLDEATLCAVRAATHTGWAMGDDRFRDRIAQLSGRRAAPLPRWRPT
jgi:putative transposase